MIERYPTISDRLGKLILGNEISLAVEGRFTNLRIWTGKDTNGKHTFDQHDTVYMRLDRANQFSAPLSETSFGYLETQQETIKELLKFGFKSSLSNLTEILELTKKMKYRDCIEW